MVSASAELCALCGFRKRELCALCGFCFVWFPQARNRVLNVTSASVELRVFCIVQQILCMQLLIL